MVNKGFTLKIFLSLILGFAFGLVLKLLPWSFDWFVYDFIAIFGEIFMRSLVMIVVPVIFVSVLCGVGTLSDLSKLGQMGSTAFLLYIGTTAVAITMAIFLATLLQVGKTAEMVLDGTSAVVLERSLSLKEIVLSWIPLNPFEALTRGDFLQLIFLAVLFGVAVIAAGQPGKRVIRFFSDINSVLTNTIMIIMSFAPIGIFALITKLAYGTGFVTLAALSQYVLVLILALIIQVVVVYGAILRMTTPYNIVVFLKKMASTMLFAFSTSSSNACIPVVLRTVKEQFHVKPAVAQFVIPLGATVNMDGTAIMQGVATVFITNAYGLDLMMTDYLTIILMATVASIGTAGVPGVGFITLTMVLNQIGLPADSIAILFGVDRLIDMLRTAVNVSGDAMVSVVVNERFMQSTAEREEHFQAREQKIPYSETKQYNRRVSSVRTLRSSIKKRKQNRENAQGKD